MPQRLAELSVIVQKRISIANRQHHVQTPQTIQQIRIGQIRQNEVAGCIEVNLFVVMAVEQIVEVLDRLGQIETTAQRHHLVKHLRMTKGEVDRMERSKLQPCAMTQGWPFFAHISGSTSFNK